MIKVFIVYQLGHRKIHKSAQHVFWSFFFPCLFFFLFSFCFFFLVLARAPASPSCFVFSVSFSFCFSLELVRRVAFFLFGFASARSDGGKGWRARSSFVSSSSNTRLVWKRTEKKMSVCVFLCACVCVCVLWGGGNGFRVVPFFFTRSDFKCGDWSIGNFGLGLRGVGRGAEGVNCRLNRRGCPKWLANKYDEQEKNER